MSPAQLLESVREKFPELRGLKKRDRRLVERALVFATKLVVHEDFLSEKEHGELMERLDSGSSLKAYRLRMNLTQAQLAGKTGIPQANLSAMETGKRPVGIKTAKKLAEILKCDFRKLV